MLSRVRVVRLQMPNNMPQKAYMEHTVFPYSHLRGRARGCEKKKEDSAKQRQADQREKVREKIVAWLSIPVNPQTIILLTRHIIK